MEYKSTLQEDLGKPLDEVERAWIRKPVTIILTIWFIIPYTVFTIIYSVYYSIREFLLKFTISCWKGPTNY